MSLNDARGLPVETDRLLIRPMQTEDAAFILELLNE
ncbi:MAG: GNAT family N-acetyltransferase, partial [Bacteroidetes bacterium]|nr:GNAT family N-acetyltransferase [Bacteroidota bacterium]